MCMSAFVNGPARAAVDLRRASVRGGLVRRGAAVLAGTGIALAGLAVLAPVASADTTINGCVIVSKPTVDKFTDCAAANLAGAALEKMDLSFANLAGANLTGTNLADSNLSGANLAAANMSLALFTNANLAKANLTNAYAPDANFDHADLREANLKGARFSGASLIGADLAGALDQNLAGAVTKEGEAPADNGSAGSATLPAVTPDTPLFGSAFAGSTNISGEGTGNEYVPPPAPMIGSAVTGSTNISGVG